jgi:hypothetical protein
MRSKVTWYGGKPVEAVKPSVFLRRTVYEKAKRHAKREGLSFSKWIELLVLENLKAA